MATVDDAILALEAAMAEQYPERYPPDEVGLTKEAIGTWRGYLTIPPVAVAEILRWAAAHPEDAVALANTIEWGGTIRELEDHPRARHA